MGDMTCDEVKQLRLGNIVVRRSKPDEYLIIDIELFIKISRMPQMFKFVALTEEWLIKFGFEINTTHSYQRYVQFNYIRIYLSNEVFKHYAIHFDAQDWCPEMSKSIIYVHQLQNLYFALTVEELKIIL